MEKLTSIKDKTVSTALSIAKTRWEVGRSLSWDFFFNTLEGTLAFHIVLILKLIVIPSDIIISMYIKKRIKEKVYAQEKLCLHENELRSNT